VRGMSAGNGGGQAGGKKERDTYEACFALRAPTAQSFGSDALHVPEAEYGLKIWVKVEQFPPGMLVASEM
jgi:hypothetical protein